MLKLNSRRIVSLCLASGLVLSLITQRGRIEKLNDSSLDIQSAISVETMTEVLSESARIQKEEEYTETYKVISIEEVANSLAEAAIEKKENNENHVIDETNENVALAIPFDESIPAVVNIEKVELEDGVVGYKYPLCYVPYLVDTTKSMPGMTAVLALSDGYEIVSECKVINKEGNKEVRNFDGCVAVYYPYYYALCLKNEDASLFEQKKEAALATYGEDSIQYKIFSSVDDLPELIISVYNEGKNESKSLSIK